jgi:hypothetical protein
MRGINASDIWDDNLKGQFGHILGCIKLTC